ncbi:MAG: TerD family protein [Clostridia bacterium]|nr:TerD family protein [Clostridia bacterium]
MLKAVCKKTGQHFGIAMMHAGGRWYAVGFVPITDTEAAGIESVVGQLPLLSHDGMPPCVKCGSRTVGGCECPAESHSCGEDGGYNFQCIYCSELDVDYTFTGVVDGISGGDVIRLSQGQVIEIAACSDEDLNGIEIGVGWDPTSEFVNIDLDSGVFVLGDLDGEDADLVYYGDKEHRSGCVKHHGDSLVGDDDENISVRLGLVPRNRNRIVFVLNIYDAKSRHQTLGGVKNMYIRLYDARHTPFAEYCVDQDVSGCTALIIGMAFRDGDIWRFKAIGQGSHAWDLLDLRRECEEFGWI